MRLPDISRKIKEIQDIPRDIFILLAIILIGIGGFLITTHNKNESNREGKLRIVKDTSFDLIYGLPSAKMSVMEGHNSSGLSSILGIYVGSRTGTTYHLPTCSGAKRIKEENRVWFNSKQEAENAGYHPALNCPGI